VPVQDNMQHATNPVTNPANAIVAPEQDAHTGAHTNAPTGAHTNAPTDAPLAPAQAPALEPAAAATGSLVTAPQVQPEAGHPEATSSLSILDSEPFVFARRRLFDEACPEDTDPVYPSHEDIYPNPLFPGERPPENHTPVSGDTASYDCRHVLKSALQIKPKFDISSNKGSGAAFHEYFSQLKALSWLHPPIRDVVALAHSHEPITDDNPLVGGYGDGLLLLILASSSVGMARAVVSALEEEALGGRPASGARGLRRLKELSLPQTRGDCLALAFECLTLSIPQTPCADPRPFIIEWLSKLSRLQSNYQVQSPERLQAGIVVRALSSHYRQVVTEAL
jgi:hypothetical protein